MNNTGEELDSFVVAAAQGERAALSRVLEIIRPLVVRYCRARVGSAERGQLSADDVAQEVCLAVMTALPRYQDQGRPFMAFVYGIAAHKVADAHRSASRNKSDPAAGCRIHRTRTRAACARIRVQQTDDRTAGNASGEAPRNSGTPSGRRSVGRGNGGSSGQYGRRGTRGSTSSPREVEERSCESG